MSKGNCVLKGFKKENLFLAHQSEVDFVSDLLDNCSYHRDALEQGLHFWANKAEELFIKFNSKKDVERVKKNYGSVQNFLSELPKGEKPEEID